MSRRLLHQWAQNFLLVTLQLFYIWGVLFADFVRYFVLRWLMDVTTTCSSACFLFLVQWCDLTAEDRRPICQPVSVSLGSDDMIWVISLICTWSYCHSPDSYICSDLMDQRSHCLRLSVYTCVFIHLLHIPPSPCHLVCSLKPRQPACYRYSHCRSHLFTLAERNRQEKWCHVLDRNDVPPNI